MRTTSHPMGVDSLGPLRRACSFFLAEVAHHQSLSDARRCHIIFTNAQMLGNSLTCSYPVQNVERMGRLPKMSRVTIGK